LNFFKSFHNCILHEHKNLAKEYIIKKVLIFYSKATLFTAPEKIYDLRVVSGRNHELEVDWTPPLNNPQNIRQYKITYQVSFNK
jgi:hypothetical protein